MKDDMMYHPRCKLTIEDSYISELSTQKLISLLIKIEFKIMVRLIMMNN